MPGTSYLPRFLRLSNPTTHSVVASPLPEGQKVTSEHQKAQFQVQTGKSLMAVLKWNDSQQSLSNKFTIPSKTQSKSPEQKSKCLNP